jgi:hypothetical protein
MFVKRRLNCDERGLPPDLRGHVVLSKPFTPAVLQRRLESVLSAAD